MRVIIAEDSALLREGLTQILTRFGHRVTAVADATELLTAATRDHPDAVITDIRMPPEFRDEGLRAALELRRRRPALPVLVLSQYVEHTYAAELLESGTAVGYLLKDRVGDVTDFIDTLDRITAGGTVVDPEVVRQLLSRRRVQGPLDRLTPREREVLALMAEGRANPAIARHLTITDAAVAKHINGIFTKLDLPTHTDGHRRVLAVLAYLRG